MAQISNILKGWANYFGGEVSDLEKKRAEICKACSHAVVGTYEQLMPDFHLKEVQGLKCDVCQCPLSTKLRSKDSKCDLNKW